MPMSKGVAFADLFDPDIVGDGPTAPGYMVSGVPLKFAAIKYGSKRADVGYAEAGVDVSNKWAAKGTAQYSHVIPDPGYAPVIANYPLSGGSGSSFVSVTLAINADGNWSLSRSDSAGDHPNVATGAWFDPTGAGSGTPYQVQFDFTATQDDGATIVNSASAWIALSSARTWGASITALNNSAGKSLAGTLRIRIRRASDSVVLSDQSVSAGVSLQAL